MALDLSQFKLQNLTLEVRYDFNFLLWDRSGSIWSEVKSKFPATKMKVGTPNEQKASLEDGLDGATLTDRTYLGAVFPPNDLEPLRTAADLLFGTALNTLKIVELTRIGMRAVYEKSFASKELVSDYLLEVHPSLRRSGKPMNIEGGRLLEPTLALRWEGNKMGCLVRIQPIEQHLEAKVPKEFPDVRSIDHKRNVAIVDVDYYAHTMTPVSRFKASAIIDSWMKIIRKEAGKFIDG